jgi:uncharacterized phage-associated protein
MGPMVLPSVGELDERLYKNAVLYFIKYCNNRYLHETKLNKLLYYLDFITYRDTGNPLTRDRYIHQKYGPVPELVNTILTQLQSAGAIGTETVPYKEGEVICFELKDETQLDENVFSKEQKKLLKSICDEFGSWPTDKIVAQTHLEAPWFYSKPYEVVDYEYSRDIDFFQK